MLQFRKRILERYRVDNVPLLLQPLFWTYAVLFAIPWILYIYIVRWTCRYQIEGDFPSRGSIHCLWHHNAWMYFCLLRHRGDTWINHPYWYMKPAHLGILWTGLKGFALGSAGHNGKTAADEVVRTLIEGRSTLVTPDGPEGPHRVLKKGVLHMSMQSGSPVLPMAFRPGRCIRLGGWDRKIFPLPFTTIWLKISAPVYVTGENFNDAAARISEALGE